MGNRPVYSFKRRQYKKKRKKSARSRVNRRRGITSKELNKANWIHVVDPAHADIDPVSSIIRPMKGGTIEDCKVIAPGICSKIFDVGNGQAEMVIKIEGRPTTLFDVKSHGVNNLETALKSYVQTYASDTTGLTLAMPNARQVLGKFMSAISQIRNEKQDEVDLS